MKKLPFFLFVCILSLSAVVRMSLLPVSGNADLVASCATPTPSGTIGGGPVPYTLELSLTKSISVTTIYTITNQELMTTYFRQRFFITPGCESIGLEINDQLPRQKSNRYTLQDASGLPSVFDGEVYIESSGRITGTTQIVSLVTPTNTPTAVPSLQKEYMPIIQR